MIIFIVASVRKECNPASLSRSYRRLDLPTISETAVSRACGTRIHVASRSFDLTYSQKRFRSRDRPDRWVYRRCHEVQRGDVTVTKRLLQTPISPAIHRPLIRFSKFDATRIYAVLSLFFSLSFSVLPS